MADPKQIIKMVRRLRALIAAFDDARTVLASSFASLDPELESLAGQVRPTVDISAALVYEFLARLEQTPEFAKVRAAALKERYP